MEANVKTETLKLWLLTQDVNDGYDTYDSMVVAAPDEASAKTLGPGELFWRNNKWHYAADHAAIYHGWAPSPDHVKAVLIGTAGKDLRAGEILCASFNAG